MIALTALILASSGAFTLPARTLSQADKRQITAAVLAKLDDHGTARFKWPAARDAELYCGWVNWRSRRGIFTGFIPFAVVGGKRHAPKSTGGFSIREITIGMGKERSKVEVLCNTAGFDVPSPVKN